ncbi:hypothetical protein AB6A40_008392 [Gnathostoma spinigerum]|uniref:Uncharacterized protein n=1 Tax=Gnathostoma spinigerum TaxID=75299 RepID=A0ABD6ENZ6_9BILA
MLPMKQLFCLLKAATFQRKQSARICFDALEINKTGRLVMRSGYYAELPFTTFFHHTTNGFASRIVIRDNFILSICMSNHDRPCNGIQNARTLYHYLIANQLADFIAPPTGTFNNSETKELKCGAERCSPESSGCFHFSTFGNGIVKIGCIEKSDMDYPRDFFLPQTACLAMPGNGTVAVVDDVEGLLMCCTNECTKDQILHFQTLLA